MGSFKAKVFHNRYLITLRHRRNVTRHLTPKKVANFLTNEVEFRARKTKLRSLPYFIKIETAGTCQLRCPGCCLGSSETAKYNKEAMLSVDGLKRIIDSLSDVLVGANLSLLGEAFLNPNLLEMVSYCRDKNVGTVFPTNLSIKLSQDEIEGVVKSGLDHLMVSIDGTTQEVFEKYRRGANLDLVLKNSAAIIAAKKALGSRYPFMEFKFILFDHNRDQLGGAEKLSQKMGFNKFSVVLDNASPVTAEAMEQARARNMAKKRACFWPWNSAVVRWDGTVLPCCTSLAKMGNIYETPFAEIWNNSKYQTLRAFFANHERNEVTKSCFPCMRF